MKEKAILNSFFRSFINFKLKDETKPIGPSNVNFDLIEWISLLKQNLYANNFSFIDSIIDRVEDTPYIEFEYSWKYVKSELSRVKEFITVDSLISASDTVYYELQNLFTFIFSQLNRLTMLHYIENNQDYFASLIEDYSKETNENQTDLGSYLRNKLKRVTFNNWRYNSLITKYENSTLWKEFLKEARNIDEHYGVLFKISNINSFEEDSFSFTIEIILTTYLFLFYLDFYLDEFDEKTKQENEGIN